MAAVLFTIGRVIMNLEKLSITTSMYFMLPGPTFFEKSIKSMLMLAHGLVG